MTTLKTTRQAPYENSFFIFKVPSARDGYEAVIILISLNLAVKWAINQILEIYEFLQQITIY